MADDPAADATAQVDTGDHEMVEFTFEQKVEDTSQRDVKRKRKVTATDKEPLLRELPLAHMYEKSFMHKDAVTHVAVTPNDFILTASADGDLRFWKKTPEDCLFVKRYRSHKEAVTALAVSDAGELCATMCHDGTVKVYDVATFDMIVMLRLPFVPGCCAFISRLGSSQKKLAISELETPKIWIYDVASGSSEPIAALDSVHPAPVTAMCANLAHGVVISADTKGFIKYWRTETYDFPVDRVEFKSMFSTDLMECVKCKCIPKAISVSKAGSLFAVTASDLVVRVFSFAHGKCKRRYREAIKDNEEAVEAEGDAVEVARRRDQEKQLLEAFAGCARGPVAAPWFNAVFDDSGSFLVFPSWRGIKVISLADNEVEHVMGEVEIERYTQVALYQGVPRGKKKARTDYAMGNAVSNEPTPDPTLVTCAIGQHRFYLFSRREPEDTDDPMLGRDVFNEKPTEDEIVGGGAVEASVKALPSGVTIHTTVGDITLRLFPDECPRTVENFTTHARNGYYDNLLFHRVIEKFMLQTGDPLGDGTGGESIWGGEFEDEIVPTLKHDRPGVLSMANAGPNTNGSQFFITTVPTPWLDGKHTVFGRVVRGMDTVSIIEKAKVDKKTDKPWEDIKMVSLTLLDKAPA